MQPRPNNDLRQIPSEKKKGIVGTLIIHGVLLILLIVIAFTPPKPPEFEKGIMVNFGTDETGIGMIEPSPPAVQEEASVPPPATATKTQKEEALLTQNNEEAPEVKKVDPEAEKKRIEKIEADRKIREQAEAERKRLEQEELERKRIEAEQKRQADIMNKTRNALANSKNAGTTSTSEGEAGGKGNQGVQTGSVDSKNRGDGSGLGNQGISYYLKDRGLQSSLPSPKYYDYQEGGIVVVEVRVDRSGKVIQAVPGSKGSTTLDADLLRVAKEAALKARFDTKTDAPAIQKGTITYNFNLK
ncbi:MAG: cell envelope integrity protein TolA [Bacteroidia bacterium]|nr:cell envelope integrity protein TolA [Bacteroidia bacterium]